MIRTNYVLPEVGAPVEGQHLLGASYAGRIASRRPHTIDPVRLVVFIDFDSPTKIAENDVRTQICTEVYPPHDGDAKWQDGYGGWFVLSPR